MEDEDRTYLRGDLYEPGSEMLSPGQVSSNLAKLKKLVYEVMIQDTQR